MYTVKFVSIISICITNLQQIGKKSKWRSLALADSRHTDYGLAVCLST